MAAYESMPETPAAQPLGDRIATSSLVKKGWFMPRATRRSNVYAHCLAISVTSF